MDGYLISSWVLLGLLTTLKEEPFEYTVRKEENAGNLHFLLFPQCFLFYPEQFFHLGHLLVVVYKCFQFGLV